MWNPNVLRLAGIFTVLPVWNTEGGRYDSKTAALKLKSGISFTLWPDCFFILLEAS